jgi:MSHA biogenesis protein MshQ
LLSADNTAGSFTPVAGIAGVIGGANTLNAFSGGVQTANGLSYSEVGSIILLAQSNDYLGTAGVNVAGRTVGPVGRFYPHYFDISNVAITSACSTGGFSYMDQPELGIQYTVEAHRKGGGITLNYFTTGYTTGTVWLVAEDSNDGTDLSARLSNTGTASWVAGVYNLSTTTAQFDRAATADGPFDALQLGVRVSDPDGAELLNRDMKADDAADCVAATSCTARALASTQVRYGRMEIANAHGSELLPLSQALYMAYYDGSGFTLHAADNCTSIGVTDLILANDIESNQRDGTIRVGSGTSTVNVQNSPAAAGRLDLSLTPPGSTGYIDIQPDLSAASGADLPWLLYDWDGDAGTADEAPTGRATFGIFGGNPQQIYIREQY